MSRTRKRRRKRRIYDDDGFDDNHPEDRRRRSSEPPPSRGSMFGGIAVGTLLVLAVLALGRNPQVLNRNGALNRGGAAQRAPNVSGSARQLLLDLAERYQGLQSYEDRSILNLAPPAGEDWRGERADLLIRFVRPNKIRMQVSRGTSQMLLTSDGEKLRTQLQDQVSGNFDNQIVEQNSPPALNLNAIFAASEITEIDQPDQLVSALMSLPCPLIVSQLALLTDPGFMPQLIESAREVKKLDDQTLSGRPCKGVQLTNENGSFTFWIDREAGLLRRIDYPAPVGNTAVDAKDTETDERARETRARLASAIVTADYDNVNVNQSFPPDNFRQQLGADAKLVQHFIVPPQIESAGVLGKRVSGYRFTDTRGEEFDPRQAGNIQLLVWFNNSAPSYAAMQKISAAYRQVQGGDVRFIGICTEPTTAMSHRDVEHLASQWEVPFTVVRDLEAHGRDTFGIAQAPTIVVTDSDNIVQLFEVGGSSTLDEELLVVVDKVRAGEPLARQYLDYLDERRRSYRQLLASASKNAPAGGNPSQTLPPSNATVARFVDVNDVWTSEPMEKPGNITLASDSAGSYLLVNNGWSKMQQLDLQGRHQASIDLDRDALATDLRIWSGASNYFVTFAERARVVSVLNDRLRTEFSYPSSDVEHDGIVDALIDDLDNDQLPELYVAFAGAAGVHCVDADGITIWEAPEIRDATALCVSHDVSGERFLLVTRADGKITPVSKTGQRNQSLEVRPLHRLFTSSDRSDDASFCGVARSIGGKNVAIGFDPSFNKTWEQEIEVGRSGRQSNNVCWANWDKLGSLSRSEFGPAGYWVAASAEGEVHIISIDGSFHDRFSIGTPIYGIAAARIGSRNLLFVSLSDRVRAMELSGR